MSIGRKFFLPFFFLAAIIPLWTSQGRCQSTSDRIQQIMTEYIQMNGDRGVQMVGVGSWISKKGYMDPLVKGGTSDHDIRLVANGLGDNAAAEEWQNCQNYLTKRIRQEFGGDADKVLSKGNVYPPDQLMQGVGDEAGAVERFNELGNSPNLSLETPEGLWGPGSIAYRQAYESSSGRIFYKDGDVVRKGFTDLTHLAEGSGVYSVEGTANTAGQWAGKLGHSLDNVGSLEGDMAGNAKDIYKYIGRMRDDINKGRSMASAAADPYLDNLMSQVDSLVDKKIVNGKTVKDLSRLEKALYNEPELVSSIRSNLSRAQFESAALSEFASGAASPRQMGVILDLLQANTGKWARFKQFTYKMANKIPWEASVKALMAFAAAYETKELAQAAGADGWDAFVEKLYADVGVGLAGMGPGILTSIAKSLLDDAKELGWDIAVRAQDCEDLLAGIYEVKGREDVPENQRLEASIDMLAKNFTTEEQVRGIVQLHARNASTRDGGAADPHIEDRLVAKCAGQIITKWKNRRLDIASDAAKSAADLQRGFNKAQLLMALDPENATLASDSGKAAVARITAKASLSVDTKRFEDDINQANAVLKTLGGKNGQAYLDVTRNYVWTVSSVQGGRKTVAEIARDKSPYLGNGPLLEPDMIQRVLDFDSPGEVTVTLRVELQTRLVAIVGDIERFRPLFDKNLAVVASADAVIGAQGAVKTTPSRIMVQEMAQAEATGVMDSILSWFGAGSTPPKPSPDTSRTYAVRVVDDAGSDVADGTLNYRADDGSVACGGVSGPSGAVSLSGQTMLFTWNLPPARGQTLRLQFTYPGTDPTSKIYYLPNSQYVVLTLPDQPPKKTPEDGKSGKDGRTGDDAGLNMGSGQGSIPGLDQTALQNQTKGQNQTDGLDRSVMQGKTANQVQTPGPDQATTQGQSITQDKTAGQNKNSAPQNQSDSSSTKNASEQNANQGASQTTTPSSPAKDSSGSNGAADVRFEAPSEVTAGDIFEVKAIVSEQAAKNVNAVSFETYSAPALKSDAASPGKTEYAATVQYALSDSGTKRIMFTATNGYNILAKGAVDIKVKPNKVSLALPPKWTASGDNLSLQTGNASMKIGLMGVTALPLPADGTPSYVQLLVKNHGKILSQESISIPNGWSGKSFLVDDTGNSGDGHYNDIVAFLLKGLDFVTIEGWGGVNVQAGSVLDGTAGFDSSGNYVTAQGDTNQAKAQLAEMRSIIASIRLDGSGQTLSQGGAAATASAGSVSVSLRTDKPSLGVGESAKLSAKATGGTPPYSYSWSAPAQGAGDTATVTAAAGADKLTATVEVKDAKGATAKANLDIPVAKLSLTLAKKSPAGADVPAGGQAAFTVTLASNGKPVKASDYVIRFEPSTEVRFAKAEGPGVVDNTATFTKPGKTKVWAIALSKTGGALSTAGESNQIEINVGGSAIALSASPSAPFPGQEVTVTAVETPKMSDADASYFWEDSQGGAASGAAGNPRQWKLTLKDDKPVTVTAHLKGKTGGDELAKASITITPKTYAVSVTNLGPAFGGETAKPVVWKPGVGLVTLDKEIAAFEDVGLRAEVEPAPANQPLRYKWTVNDGATVSGNAAARETRVQRATKGGIEATVEARDANNVLLGTGTASVTVSYSGDEVKAGKQKAAELEKLKQEAQQAWNGGDTGPACDKGKAAAQIDPKSLEAKTYCDGRDKIAELVKGANTALAKPDPDKAASDLDAARKINPKAKELADLERAIKDARDKSGKTDTLLQSAEAKWKAGDAEGALSAVGQALQSDPQNAKALEAKKRYADGLGKLKNALAKAEDFKAKKDYDKALAAVAEGKTVNAQYTPLDDLEKEIDAEKGKAAAADKLVAEAKSAWDAGDVDTACSKSKQALAPDANYQPAKAEAGRDCDGRDKIAALASQAQSEIAAKQEAQARQRIEDIKRINAKAKALAELEKKLDEKPEGKKPPDAGKKSPDAEQKNADSDKKPPDTDKKPDDAERSRRIADITAGANECGKQNWQACKDKLASALAGSEAVFGPQDAPLVKKAKDMQAAAEQNLAAQNKAREQDKQKEAERKQRLDSIMAAATECQKGNMETCKQRLETALAGADKALGPQDAEILANAKTALAEVTRKVEENKRGSSPAPTLANQTQGGQTGQQVQSKAPVASGSKTEESRWSISNAKGQAPLPAPMIFYSNGEVEVPGLWKGTWVARSSAARDIMVNGETVNIQFINNGEELTSFKKGVQGGYGKRISGAISGQTPPSRQPAAPPPPAVQSAQSSFDGRYQGEFNGNPNTLTFVIKGGRIEGDVNYTFTSHGQPAYWRAHITGTVDAAGTVNCQYSWTDHLGKSGTGKMQGKITGQEGSGDTHHEGSELGHWKARRM
ncbi:MAG: hypothetical protein HQK82_07600 [Desulfovibrionaceae bacterium]|nr:hypothetical protein [Desulfovibrionaceae bacterium]